MANGYETGIGQTRDVVRLYKAEKYLGPNLQLPSGPGAMPHTKAGYISANNLKPKPKIALQTGAVHTYLKLSHFFVERSPPVNLHEKLTQLGGSFAFNFDPPSLIVPSAFGREF